MAGLVDIMATTQIFAEDSDIPMGGFRSKLKVDLIGLSSVKKDNVDSVASATVVDKEFFSSSEIGNLRGEGYGGTMGGEVVGYGSSDGKISDGDFSCAGNVERDDYKRWKERERIDLNGERLEDHDDGFQVGDLVWGRIKIMDPWWPGQVYDLRDASDFALKHRQEGRVLVAFFGDGSCSWCLPSPSQLIPFVANLEEKSKIYSDNSSKGFVKAVQMAVDEIGRVVESKITCKCLEKRDHLARPMVANAGVREGVLVPEVDIDRLPIPEYESAGIVAKVKDLAKSVSVGSLIDLAVLRSWISSYHYAMCGCRLPVNSEPLFIQGLEDKSDGETAVCEDDVPTPSHGPKADDKVYQRRKKKSVAEIMDKKNISKSKRLKKNDVKKEKDDGKSANGSSLKSLKTKRGSKRRANDTLMVKVNETEVASDENTCDEESKMISASRERKRSKYLSPPYTNIKGRSVNSESDKPMELDNASEDNSGSAPVSENEETMTISASAVDNEVDELLLKLGVAAVDHLYLRKSGYLDSVWAFISGHRSSTYLRGVDSKVHRKNKRVSHKRMLSLPCSPSSKRPAEEGPMDDLKSDARIIRQKVDKMTDILDYCGSNFSSDDKSCLQHEMKHLVEKVEMAFEKVRVMAQNSSSSFDFI